MNTAEKRGRKEGEKEGRKEGEKAGVEKTARSMLTEGMDPTLIAKITNLPVTEIEALCKAN
jgi:predicted transposase/invertase (TIGR01784 family)